jgi:hypothetical protein
LEKGLFAKKRLKKVRGIAEAMPQIYAINPAPPAHGTCRDVR